MYVVILHIQGDCTVIKANVGSILHPAVLMGINCQAAGSDIIDFISLVFIGFYILYVNMAGKDYFYSMLAEHFQSILAVFYRIICLYHFTVVNQAVMHNCYQLRIILLRQGGALLNPFKSIRPQISALLRVLSRHVPVSICGIQHKQPNIFSRHRK